MKIDVRGCRLAVCGALVCASLLSATSAGAQRLYDMNRLLAQPHPFANPNAAVPAPPPRLAPAAVPLPGSQYRVAAPYGGVTVPAVQPPAARPAALSRGRAAPLPGSQYQVTAPGLQRPPAFTPVAPPVPSPQAASAGLAPASRERGWIYIPDPPPGSTPLYGLVAEARLGVLDHASSILGAGKEDGINISPELLFVSPGFMRWIGSPMPHLGAQFNTAGERNLYYAGLTWRIGLFGIMHVDLGFGMGVHDGDLGDAHDTKGMRLGCRWQFREAIAIGFMLGERHTIALQADHFSHAHLCSDNNDGTESLGIVYGYRF